jgi:NitT/TauT family transport system ATP-binding protein
MDSVLPAQALQTGVNNQSPADPILVVRELSAVFSKGEEGLQALDHLTFSVNPQDFVCVLGPSGSGKSTLLRILAGLLPPTEGEIFYRGERINGPRREVGMVFQRPNLMPWRTVLQNITLPLELQRLPMELALERARELIDLVGLQGFEDTLPRDLSGGMAQRVAIARALVHDPDMLLLDEPFGGLDALTRERMGAELLRIWQKRRKTVVMVTHSISEALFLADRVLVFSPRPGSLRLDLAVEFPRPRQEGVQYTPEFGELASRVREAIG